MRTPLETRRPRRRALKARSISSTTHERTDAACGNPVAREQHRARATDPRSLRGFSRTCSPALAFIHASVLGILWFSLLALSSAAAAAEKDDSKKERAKLTITGLGWFENLRMKNLLRQLRPQGEMPATLDANAIEDGAFFLLNHVQNLGYLDAAVTTIVEVENGPLVKVTWSGEDLQPLPRPLTAREVRYEVTPGMRYYYTDLRFEGLTVLRPDDARRYFVRTDGLLRTKALLRFSRSEFKQATGNLASGLKRMGYADAEVTASDLQLDEDTGQVRAVVKVKEGPLHRIRQVRVTVREIAEGAVVQESTFQTNRIYSTLAVEDLEQELLVEWFHQGYPDATARIIEEGDRTTEDGLVLVDLHAEIIRGPRVKLGEVRFEGPIRPQTADSLARRVDLEGPWLDRLEVDDARVRLARLGGFRFINVDYETSTNDPAARNAVFKLEPGRRFSVDLLAGFRSYELLYGGVDIARRNLFGAGHSAELRLIQSFKSSEGYVTYSIPDAFAEDVTIFALAEALRREEISFRREELRTAIGVRHVFPDSGHQIGLRYNYELLRAVDAPTAQEAQPDVASLTLDWSLDRRDSAITPRRGFQVAAALEFAQPEFGGESRFLRPDVRATAHLPLGGGRFFHVGVRYMLVADPSGDDLIPFNKRIFPGGEDSVRGYQRGEAAPRDTEGELIGAESAFVWNLEFEQLLTPTWSVVAFADGLAQTADIHEFPWDEVLWSVGAGVRWNTAIGPVRFEYGYNLNRRDDDPAGTFHFSVGFPF